MSLLNKWTLGLCARSRYKQDFSNIKLMLMLLKSKGFPIPEVDPASVDALVGTEEDALRSKEDIEAEERTVLETKLEDLLQRGKPADLLAANQLMRRLVGSSEEGNVPYSTSEGRVDHELNLLAEKIDLLDSMATGGSQAGDAYQTLFDECKGLVPRMFQLANSELSEGVMMKLLALNQRLHEVVGAAERSPVHAKGDLHMDMLIQFDTAGDAPASKTTSDIMELFKLESPRMGLEGAPARLSYFVGSPDLLVDILTMNGCKYLRVFNPSPAVCSGVEVNEVCLGAVQPLATSTAKVDPALNLDNAVTLQLRYQLNGQQIAKKLSLSLIN